MTKENPTLSDKLMREFANALVSVAEDMVREGKAINPEDALALLFSNIFTQEQTETICLTEGLFVRSPQSGTIVDILKKTTPKGE